MPTRVAAVAVAVLAVGGCAADPGVTVTTSGPTTASATTVPSTSITAAVTTVTSASTATTAASAAKISGELGVDDIADQLTEIERAAAAGDASSGTQQQLLYRYLSFHPELDAGVLAAVGEDVRPYVSRIISARQFAQTRSAASPSTTPPSDTLPAWTIVEPLPQDELLGYYRAAEAATGIAWYWLAAIHLQETRMGRIVGASSAGAVGPMQFLPATWAQCCTGDPLVARDAIVGAATYLVQGGGPADMAAALHEYNPNDSYVATVTAFAENLRDNPQLFAAYRDWQVFYGSAAGPVRLPVGYSQSAPIDAAAYLAEHPDDAG